MPRKILPPPIDEAELEAGVLGGLHFLGHALHRLRIDAELARSHQHFARELEQDALVR